MVKVKGTFEIKFVYDEKTARLYGSLKSNLMDSFVDMDLPMGCEPRKKDIRIRGFEKELIEKEREGLEE